MGTPPALYASGGRDTARDPVQNRAGPNPVPRGWGVIAELIRINGAVVCSRAEFLLQACSPWMIFPARPGLAKAPSGGGGLERPGREFLYFRDEVCRSRRFRESRSAGCSLEWPMLQLFW